MELKEHAPHALCLDLPTERDPVKVAERIANKRGRIKAIWRMVTVTDEHGTIIAKSRSLEELARPALLALTYETATAPKYCFSGSSRRIFPVPVLFRLWR